MDNFERELVEGLGLDWESYRRTAMRIDVESAERAADFLTAKRRGFKHNDERIDEREEARRSAIIWLLATQRRTFWVQQLLAGRMDWAKAEAEIQRA